jgi:lipopolysaccharide transport system permease protein
MSTMQETVIEAGRPEKHYWIDIWKFRELLWILGMRDVTVRYKQTIFGVAWSVVRPLSFLAVLWFAFSKVAKLPSEPGVPYLLMAYPGILLWNFFANAFTQVSSSIVHNANLVSKVYFPRLIMPVSSIMVGAIDFLVGFALIIPLYLYYGFVPGWQLIFVPFFLLLAFLAAFGFGLIFAVFNVKYRDFTQVAPFIIQFGFYASPVGYTSEAIANNWWYGLYNLNPVVGLIDGFRWSLLGGYAPFRMESFLPAILIILAASVISIIFFRKRENTFVDYI